MNLYPWAMKWGVSLAALEDLARELGQDGAGRIPEGVRQGESEGAAQAAVRLEAAQKGVRLYRNNVGSLVDERGVPVRYGLANESPAVNRMLKSADLIGIRPILITPLHVGATIGQFVSREIKRPGWRYSGGEHEEAQRRWALLIASLGGDAGFATGAGTL